jgi:hypothetical protein
MAGNSSLYDCGITGFRPSSPHDASGQSKRTAAALRNKDFMIVFMPTL